MDKVPEANLVVRVDKDFKVADPEDRDSKGIIKDPEVQVVKDFKVEDQADLGFKKVEDPEDWDKGNPDKATTMVKDKREADPENREGFTDKADLVEKEVEKEVEKVSVALAAPAVKAAVALVGADAAVKAEAVVVASVAEDVVAVVAAEGEEGK